MLNSKGLKVVCANLPHSQLGMIQFQIGVRVYADGPTGGPDWGLQGDGYSIFLDGLLLPEIRDFLRTRKEKGAIEIGGKKWAASVRAVFPSEPVWRTAIQNAQRK